MDDMTLPAGKTCKDCAHWPRCSWLIDDLAGEETECDWAPSKFKPNGGNKDDQQNG